MNKIKELRQEKRLTQSDIAKILNVNQTAVGKYERAELEPSIKSLIILSKFFEVSIDYILGNSDDFGNITIKNSSTINTEEEILLQNYRSLPKQEQAQAFEYVNYLAEKRGNKNQHA